MKTPFLDRFMHDYTDIDQTWMIPIIVISLIALWRGKSRALWVIVLAGITIGLSDYMNSSILKDLFGRIRPCHIFADLYILDHCGYSFSFPSSHCTNFSSVGTFLTLNYPKLGFVLVPLVLIMAVSRVYVGVHYPLDALGGIILGIIWGFVCYRLGLLLESRWERRGVFRAIRSFWGRVKSRLGGSKGA